MAVSSSVAALSLGTLLPSGPQLGSSDFPGFYGVPFGLHPAARDSHLGHPSFGAPVARWVRPASLRPPTPPFPTPHHTPSRLFTLTAEGPTSANGPIRQITDGQNRIGGTESVGTFLLKDGRIFDTFRRGCTLAPPTTQWQCDEGNLPLPGFGISKDGLLTYRDRTTFWACPVNDFGVWNTYTEPVKNQLKCVEIKLHVHERGQSGEQSSSSRLSEGRPQASSQGISQSTRRPNYLPQPRPGPNGPIPWGKPAPPPSPSPVTRVGGSSASPSQAPSAPVQSAPVERPSQVPPTPSALSRPSSVSQAPESVIRPERPERPSSEAEFGVPVESPEGLEGLAPTPSTPSISVDGQLHKESHKGKGKEKEKGKQAGCPFSKGKAQPPCDLDLKGKFAYPELIIPVSEHLDETALGAHRNGTIAPGLCSLFNFNIDARHKGKKCTLMFLLPKREKPCPLGRFDLRGRYELKGKGNLYFFWLEKFAGLKTTWVNKSKATPFEIGPQAIEAGSKIAVHTGDCPAGERFTVQICGDGNLKLEYEQDMGAESMGLFVRVC